MIESMACGTPVVAYEGGSVSEVMEDGVTGFIVHEIDQAVEAVRHVRDLSRARCREVFENRFTANRMASDCVNAYMRLADPRMQKMEQPLELSLRACQSVYLSFRPLRLRSG
jgi:glycosyltransferase involved in cell wall biosynthesis